MPDMGVAIRLGGIAGYFMVFESLCWYCGILNSCGQLDLTSSYTEIQLGNPHGLSHLHPANSCNVISDHADCWLHIISQKHDVT